MNAAFALFLMLTLCIASALAGIGVDNLRFESRRSFAAFLLWMSGIVFGAIAAYSLQLIVDRLQ
jgi:hypothetical protein